MLQPFLANELSFFDETQRKSCKKLKIALNRHIEYLASLTKQLPFSEFTESAAKLSKRSNASVDTSSSTITKPKSGKSVVGRKRKLRSPVLDSVELSDQSSAILSNVNDLNIELDNHGNTEHAGDVIVEPLALQVKQPDDNSPIKTKPSRPIKRVKKAVISNKTTPIDMAVSTKNSTAANEQKQVEQPSASLCSLVDDSTVIKNLEPESTISAESPQLLKAPVNDHTETSVVTQSTSSISAELSTQEKNDTLTPVTLSAGSSKSSDSCIIEKQHEVSPDSQPLPAAKQETDSVDLLKNINTDAVTPLHETSFPTPLEEPLSTEQSLPIEQSPNSISSKISDKMDSVDNTADTRIEDGPNVLTDAVSTSKAHIPDSTKPQCPAIPLSPTMARSRLMNMAKFSDILPANSVPSIGTSSLLIQNLPKLSRSTASKISDVSSVASSAASKTSKYQSTTIKRSLESVSEDSEQSDFVKKSKSMEHDESVQSFSSSGSGFIDGAQTNVDVDENVDSSAPLLETTTSHSDNQANVTAPFNPATLKLSDPKELSTTHVPVATSQLNTMASALQHSSYVAPSILTQIASQVDASREMSELRLKTAHAGPLEMMRRGLNATTLRLADRSVSAINANSTSAIHISSHSGAAALLQLAHADRSSFSTTAAHDVVASHSISCQPEPNKKSEPETTDTGKGALDLQMSKYSSVAETSTTSQLKSGTSLSAPLAFDSSKPVLSWALPSGGPMKGSSIFRTPVKAASSFATELVANAQKKDFGSSHLPVISTKNTSALLGVSGVSVAENQSSVAVQGISVLAPSSIPAGLPPTRAVVTITSDIPSSTATVSNLALIQIKSNPIIEPVAATEVIAKKELIAKETHVQATARMQQRSDDAVHTTLAKHNTVSMHIAESQSDVEKPHQDQERFGTVRKVLDKPYKPTNTTSLIVAPRSAIPALVEHSLNKPFSITSKPLSGETAGKQKLPLSYSAQATLTGQLSDLEAPKTQVLRPLPTHQHHISQDQHKLLPQQKLQLLKQHGAKAVLKSNALNSVLVDAKNGITKNLILPSSLMGTTHASQVPHKPQVGASILSGKGEKAVTASTQNHVHTILGEDGELPEPPSDYSDSDDDSLTAATPRGGPKIATWASTPYIRQVVTSQQQRDPDDIFGTVKTCQLEEIFDSKESKKLKKRTSSAHWLGTDALTFEEEMAYKKDMGYVDGESGVIESLHSHVK
ncbi:hypothetical protein O5D80_003021 [Batrachochytrium dendrobatidis]|nr:hypothetical protein O5D80_003021 [Batrachochytrium dendrobatidis]